MTLQEFKDALDLEEFPYTNLGETQDEFYADNEAFHVVYNKKHDIWRGGRNDRGTKYYPSGTLVFYVIDDLRGEHARYVRLLGGTCEF